MLPKLGMGRIHIAWSYRLHGSDNTAWPGKYLTEVRMDAERLMERITYNPEIFGGKPIIRGRRLAVEHVLGMLAAGDDIPTLLEGYPWLEREDILACLEYARRMLGHERIEPFLVREAA